MQTCLEILCTATDGSQFSADQCVLIVRELSEIDPLAISIDQTRNVLDFLNVQLLYEQVDREILERIEDLAAKLARRLANVGVS